MYYDFVQCGVDDATADFYSKTSLKPVFGTERFKSKLKSLVKINREIPESKAINKPTTIDCVIEIVSQYYQCDKEVIVAPSRGQKNEARSVAVYLSKKLTLSKLNEIAFKFNYKSYEAVASVIASFEKKLTDDRELKVRIELICKKFM